MEDSMDYQNAVAQAANALTRGEDANWELARLTYENTKTLGDPGSQPDKTTMDEWCTDVRVAARRKFSISAGTLFKAVWTEYGGLHAEDRPEWLEAVRAVRPAEENEAKRERTALAYVHAAPPEIKRDLAVKLMNDPDVADAVIGDVDSRLGVFQALNRFEQQAQAEAGRIRESDPISSELHSIDTLMKFDNEIHRFLAHCTLLFHELATIPSLAAAENHGFIQANINRVREYKDRLESFHQNGQTDLDEFLDSVLNGKG